MGTGIGADGSPCAEIQVFVASSWRERYSSQSDLGIRSTGTGLGWESWKVDSKRVAEIIAEMPGSVLGSAAERVVIGRRGILDRGCGTRSGRKVVNAINDRIMDWLTGMWEMTCLLARLMEADVEIGRTDRVLRCRGWWLRFRERLSNLTGCHCGIVELQREIFESHCWAEPSHILLYPHTHM